MEFIIISRVLFYLRIKSRKYTSLILPVFNIPLILVFNSSAKDLEENKKKARRLLDFTKKASECFYQVSKIESLRKEYSDVL
mgnify:CR=1 FL=1